MLPIYAFWAPPQFLAEMDILWSSCPTLTVVRHFISLLIKFLWPFANLCPKRRDAIYGVSYIAINDVSPSARDHGSFKRSIQPADPKRHQGPSRQSFPFRFYFGYRRSRRDAIYGVSSIAIYGVSSIAIYGVSSIAIKGVSTK